MIWESLNSPNVKSLASSAKGNLKRRKGGKTGVCATLPILEVQLVTNGISIFYFFKSTPPSLIPLFSLFLAIYDFFNIFVLAEMGKLAEVTCPRPIVYLDIEIDGTSIGRAIFELVSILLDCAI